MKVYLIRDECTGYYHLGGDRPSHNDVEPPKFYAHESSAKFIARKLTRWCERYSETPHDYQVIECKVTPLS